MAGCPVPQVWRECDAAVLQRSMALSPGPGQDAAGLWRLGLRMPLWAAPVATAATAALGCCILLVADPREPGSYPTCPFLALTGRWCPGCGTLRGLRSLLAGDVGAALGFNVLMVTALPLILLSYLRWALPRFGLAQIRLPSLPACTGWAVLAAVVCFWVVRNIPLAPLTALAP